MIKVNCKELDFIKMHGAGNDYVYIDCTGRYAPLMEQDVSGLARAVSDRHFGVGGDGLVLIGRGTDTDFRMRMFNNDGSEAQMCGNATRCIGKYVSDSGLTSKPVITLRTLAGVKVLTLHRDADGLVESVTVDMGVPVTEAKNVPAVCRDAVMKDFPLECGGREFRVTAVSMGNPHAVIFTDDLSDENVLHYGPLLERHPAFPEKANIEFVRVKDPGRLEMRVWERGTGETLACGTGACATAVAAVMNGLTDWSVEIELRGGTLSIGIADDGHVMMTGPAAITAYGKYLLPASLATMEIPSSSPQE